MVQDLSRWLGKGKTFPHHPPRHIIDLEQLPGSTRGDDDYWGVKDLNTCCGRMNIKIPTDIPSGDYLFRPEVIALHSAGSLGGAQFYLSCCKFAHHCSLAPADLSQSKSPSQAVDLPLQDSSTSRVHMLPPILESEPTSTLL